MQATVFTFDPDSHEGSVITDDGRIVAFDAAAFDAGGLRLLSRGQRVRATQSASGRIVAVTIYTLADMSGFEDGAADQTTDQRRTD